MSRIAYDPVKNQFADIIRDHRYLRTLFYKILDLFFLRSWYIRKFLGAYGREFDEKNAWKLLDAGCGFGQYDRFILQQFSQVEVKAIDVKKDYLADCRAYFADDIQRERISFSEANLLALPYNGQFDMAICVDVMEHIAEDVKAMQNICAALKLNRYFIMHSPSIYSAEDAGAEESFVDEHARTGYSIEGLTKKLHQAGFSTVKLGYTYGDKGHLAWQLIIKYPMLWMNKINRWALPVMAIYFIFTLPVSLVMMWADMRGKNKKGTGIYAIAKKK